MARIPITLTLQMSEIVYDVQNETYLTGRSRSNGQNHEQVANMQNNDDEENLNQVLRNIGTAFATLKTELSEYIVGTTSSANDTLMDVEASLVLTLTMPSNYDKATVDTLVSAAHQYIVCTAVSKWFLITNKADAGDYVNQAASYLEQIRKAANRRVRPIRPEGNDNP